MQSPPPSLTVPTMALDRSWLEAVTANRKSSNANFLVLMMALYGLRPIGISCPDKFHEYGYKAVWTTPSGHDSSPNLGKRSRVLQFHPVATVLTTATPLQI